MQPISGTPPRPPGEGPVTPNTPGEQPLSTQQRTVLERLIEDISYDASEMNGQTVTIDAEYVGKHLDVLVADEDLSRFIL